MGSQCSTIQLDESDIDELKKETGFSSSQIKRLYSRFSNLDKGNNACLTREDFLRIPELAINPLGERVVNAFFVAPPSEGGQDPGINFKDFVKALARFRREDDPNSHHLNKRENKLEYAFRVYDIDNTRKITKDNLCQILSLMVGANKSSEQLLAIADRTMLEADGDKDGYIDFEEFARVMANTDFQAKMSIRFLA